MKVFVLMPFDNGVSNDIYNHCVKTVCQELDLDVFRADEIFSPNIIIDDILTAINEAAIIIADISGKNSNVFYELGIAHFLKRNQTIMIHHEDYSSIPFDISHYRIIHCENTIPGKTKFENQLKQTIKTMLRDYKAIFKEEFSLVARVLTSAEKEIELLSLVSITKLSQPLIISECFFVAGHNENYEYELLSGSSEEYLTLFIRLGYIELINDFLIVTEKGKAFASYLEDHGFVCNCINGMILTKDFAPIFDYEKHKTEKRNWFEGVMVQEKTYTDTIRSSEFLIVNAVSHLLNLVIA